MLPEVRALVNHTPAGENFWRLACTKVDMQEYHSHSSALLQKAFPLKLCSNASTNSRFDRLRSSMKCSTERSIECAGGELSAPICTAPLSAVRHCTLEGMPHERDPYRRSCRSATSWPRRAALRFPKTPGKRPEPPLLGTSWAPVIPPGLTRGPRPAVVWSMN